MNDYTMSRDMTLIYYMSQVSVCSYPERRGGAAFQSQILFQVSGPKFFLEGYLSGQDLSTHPRQDKTGVAPPS